MSGPKDVWKGQFGMEYTDRNVVDWRQRLPAFRTMLGGLGIQSVLEVGCNRGHNLKALSELLPGAQIAGVEPNAYARELAGREVPDAKLVGGSGDSLPFGDASFDLVFTAGVLIHIPPDELPRVLSEVLRVSRHYALAIEYYADEDEEITYRDRSGLLWKRNFPRHYLKLNPELRRVREGYWSAADGFDRCHWWVFEKPASSA